MCVFVRVFVCVCVICCTVCCQLFPVKHGSQEANTEVWLISHDFASQSMVSAGEMKLSLSISSPSFTWSLFSNLALNHKSNSERCSTQGIYFHCSFNSLLYTISLHPFRPISPYFSVFIFVLQSSPIPPNTVVLCSCAVSSSHVLLGTNSGQVLVYDAYTRRHTHSLYQLPDSVLCLYHVK